jgi:two-component system C4-dicarboxylate transport response regulator DctD
MRALMSHDWPGNVRELRNAAERFVLGLAGGDVVSAAPVAALTLPQQLDQIEKALIEQALRQHRGRPVPVCEALGIGRKTLYDKITRHGIVLDDYRSAPGSADEA